MTKEPDITINGITLKTNQAMTIRVAIENFDLDLRENGLGDDGNGKVICEGYRRCINEIRSLIFR